MKKTAHGTILKIFVFIIGLALPVVPLSAIELEEFLSLVESNHPFFSKESLAVEVEEARRDTMLPRYEWSYSLTPQYTIAEPPSSADLFSNLMQTASLEAGMERGFADGRQVGLSVSTSYTVDEEDVAKIYHGIVDRV